MAATSEVVLSARAPDDLDSLLLYLRLHGAFMRRLLVTKAPAAVHLYQLQYLPPSCSHLQDLQIGACNVVNIPSVLSDLTSLTRLEVFDSARSTDKPWRIPGA